MVTLPFVDGIQTRLPVDSFGKHPHLRPDRIEAGGDALRQALMNSVRARVSATWSSRSSLCMLLSLAAQLCAMDEYVAVALAIGVDPVALLGELLSENRS
ncbi:MULTISPECIES: hypothetical protein [Sphingomonas]|uniref:hypothetical protein n=1 Tax=Sphingomonas TaxID=13687 RepID=UPI00082998A0|nr:MULTISPECIES: hypothetical protein [Sphingomonas]MBY0302988.1 hypothetical protein [Sphingomonas ginsenosidimutans]